MFRDPALSAGLGMSTLVSTLMLSTLVVGRFYLSRALGLEATLVGVVLSVGPLVPALADVPATLGIIFGMLGLSRNLGLIGGASVTGAVFALASSTTNIRTAPQEPSPPARGSRSRALGSSSR
jgi:hypothetical protein